MTRSEDLYKRALEVLPGGVSRNTVLRTPQPYADFGKGCQLVDLEGVSRIDFSNNMASLLHGHADPEIVEAVTQQLKRGTAFTMATEIEVEYAEHLCSRNDSFEQLRFVNSGTEAIMACLKASRAYTGKPMIAKVEGAYHGQYDYAEVSQTPTPENWGDVNKPNSVPVAHGTPDSALNDVVIIPFNDVERALARLNEHADEIACVLLDLMPHRVGLRPAEEEFVEALREWTEQHGALLVLDEVITFRSEYGGLQERYDITPDLTALGKAIGGGFPVGALAGKKEVMDVMNPKNTPLLFPHSGTFSANPITLTAGLTAMKKFDKLSVARLNALTRRAIEGIEQAISETGATACVTGGGSLFRIHFKEAPPSNFREAFTTTEENERTKQMLDHLFGSGFVLINTCSGALSTPMTETDIDALVNAIKGDFQKL
ncbi:MAG: aspartate aminotransferase family protein [Planctomycetes bacterium]|nr:aspartate aminotransferase family protein [Planctomycetota bacterium]